MTLQERRDALLEIQAKSQVEAALALTALAAPLTPHATAPGHGGINTTYSGWLTTGEMVFHKPFSGVHVAAAYNYGHTKDDPPMHEVAAWRLARALGSPWDAMVPPSVLRDVPGVGLGSFTLGISGVPRSNDPFTKALDQVNAAALWDSLTGQQDRHLGNYRWEDGQGRLHLIDHGFCFAEPGHLLHATAFVEFRHAQNNQVLTSTELGVLNGLVASPNLYGLADILGGKRADSLRDRAKLMLSTNQLLPPNQF